MSSAEERKKAREEYLATLQKQRGEAAQSSSSSSSSSVTSSSLTRDEKMRRREEMLEEKKKRFLQQQQQQQRQGSPPSASSVKNGISQESRGDGRQGGGSQVVSNTPLDGHRIPPTSLQRGKEGDDGASALEERFGDRRKSQRSEIVEPSKSSAPKSRVIQPHEILNNRAPSGDKNSDRDPFGRADGELSSQEDSRAQDRRDPFAQTVHPSALQEANKSHQTGSIVDQIGGRGGVPEEREARRLKQEEYARQLQQDGNLSHQLPTHPSRQQPSFAPSGGLALIGQRDETADKESKRSKQAEYARQLQQDGSLAIGNPPRDNRHMHHYDDKNQDPFAPIGQENTKDAKRNKQAEYARQLQQDGSLAIGNPPRDNRHMHHYDDKNQDPFAPIGQENTKDAKRNKQAEYARQLEQDIQVANRNNANSTPNSHRRADPPRQANPLPAGGLLSRPSEEDEKAAKRAKQAEYNRQLQQDVEMNQRKAPNHSSRTVRDNIHEGNGFALPSGHFAASPGNDEKAQKRAKQAEYNRQLQEHGRLKRQQDERMLSQQQSQLRGYHQPTLNSPRRPQLGQAGEGQDAGWEIGPLGQPVRKTLLVGNRGLQKAYVHQKHSPVKGSLQQQQAFGYPQGHNQFSNEPSSSYQSHLEGSGHDGYDNYSHGNNNGNGAQYGSDITSEQRRVSAPRSPGGSVSGGANGRASSQTEHARALEEQIRLKKESVAAAKEAEAEEEARLYQKLEREREEMQRAFDEEQRKKKEKLENERVAALELQIHQKQQQKLEEEKRQKELDRREDERVRKEQAEMAAQLEEELRRDQQTSDPPSSPELGAKKSRQATVSSPLLPAGQRNKSLFRPPSPIATPDDIQQRSPEANDSSGRRDRLFEPPSPKTSASGTPSRRETPVAASARHTSRQRGEDVPSRGSQRPQVVEMDPNHPVILDLKRETEHAKSEAARAREELAHLRKLMSQDRKRPVEPKAVEVPPLDRKHLAGREQAAPSEDDLSRVDSARTFIRKYQASYHADKPPKTSKRPSQLANASLERSLKSESVLHEPNNSMGHELPEDFHALLETDETLQSESRFVYPDGRAFMGSEDRPSSAKPRPQLKYRLQPYESSAMIPLQIPLPDPPSAAERAGSPIQSPQRSISTLGNDSPAGSAVTLQSERLRRQGKPPEEESLDFDVDRAFRRNRRKLELLGKLHRPVEEGLEEGLEGGCRDQEELDLLVRGMQSVSSSRPTTANSESLSSRPGSQGTLRGESHFLGRDFSLLQHERDKYKQRQQPRARLAANRQQNRLPREESSGAPLQQPRPSSSSSVVSSEAPSPRRTRSQGKGFRSSGQLRESGRRALNSRGSDLQADACGNQEPHHSDDRLYSSISEQRLQNIDYSEYGF